MKAVPETATTITNIISSEINKLDESKVLSDDKLIHKSTKVLRGKGFNVTINFKFIYNINKW